MSWDESTQDFADYEGIISSEDAIDLLFVIQYIQSDTWNHAISSHRSPIDHLDTYKMQDERIATIDRISPTRIQRPVGAI